MFELHFTMPKNLFFKSMNHASKKQKAPFKELVKEWLGHIEHTVKPSTFQKYEGIVRRHILPRLGDVPLHTMDRSILYTFGEHCLLSGLREKTVNDILGVVRSVFRYIQEEYDLSLPTVPFWRQPPTETRVLSMGEEEILLDYVINNLDRYHFGILLTLYTGLRIGELCALQWQDISDTSVKVSKTLQRLSTKPGKTQLVVGEPKSMNSYREIPIPDCLQPYISKFRQEDGFLLETKSGKPTEPRTLQAKFSHIVDVCNLPGVTFHTLRHTFATRCVEAGFDLKSLSEILGHRDVKTTMNLYVHPSFQFKKENMEKLAHPLLG